MSASPGFWDASHFNLHDPINEEIWKESKKLQMEVQPWQDLQSADSIGAQQAMFGSDLLPWVPDLVGRESNRPEGVVIVGSAYAGFIAPYSSRGFVLPLERYNKADNPESFQRAFLQHVVVSDRAYYGGIKKLAKVGGWESRRMVLCDLCRVSFVCRGSQSDRRDESGDRVVRTGATLFEKYVDARNWTERRLRNGNARTILALGTIAEHGVLRMFSQCGMIVRAKLAENNWRFSSERQGEWVCDYADRGRKITHWESHSDWWTIETPKHEPHRVWHLLPVRHPARCHSYEHYREVISLMKQ